MTNKNLVLDSSVLIPLLCEEEIHSDYSKDLLKAANQTNRIFIIPMLVLFEVFHNLKKRGFFEIPMAFEKFRDLFNYPNFQYIDLNLDFFNLFRQVDVFDNLKTSDATIAAAAFLTKSVLISWDLDLNKNAYEAYTPKEFINTLL
ncbi:PIN domain-containing protein [Candidatus Peregrinibacteria bacterium]|nr:PIN domain-containing protein [Candidatus Peregrinibacteria bacterium]